MCNTTISRPESLKSHETHPDVVMEGGGLSGKPLKEMSTKLIGEVRGEGRGRKGERKKKWDYCCFVWISLFLFCRYFSDIDYFSYYSNLPFSHSHFNKYIYEHF